VKKLQVFTSNVFQELLAKNLKSRLLRIRGEAVQRNHKVQRLSFLGRTDKISKIESNYLSEKIKQGKSVCGYVPFSYGQTEIIIYNFFSINYGFRSKGKILVALTDKLFNPLNVNVYEVEHRQIITLSLDLPKQVTEPTFCVVLMAHDQIRPNHGGPGGHLRFWGVWNKFSAFTHSMPLPESSWLDVFLFRNIAKSNFADRRFYPSQAKVVDHYGFRDGRTKVNGRGDLSEQLNLNFGFSTISSKDSDIVSCYHNSPYTRKKIILSSQKTEHIVAILPVEDIEVYMFFGECCTIGSKFTVSLHSASPLNNLCSNTDRLQEQVIEITTFDPIKLSSLFPDNPKFGQTACWLNFRPLSGKHRSYYINVIYGNQRTQEVFDGVHSHSLSSPSKFGIARSLKFAPFRLGNYKNEYEVHLVTFKSLLVVWGDTDNTIECRLRFFSKSDLNFERVHGFRINKNEVKYFDLSYYIEPCFVKEGSLFLVQLESEQQNLNANLYCLKETEGKGLTALAVDHLTGG
jgi:hypothetical protein